MRKVLYILAALLAFASANGTSRSTNKVTVVYREQSDGHWQTYVFGLQPCSGRVTVEPSHDQTDPLKIVCK